MLGPWHLRRHSRSDVSYVHIIDMHHYELILPLQPPQPTSEFPRHQHLHPRQEQAPTTTIIVLLLRCLFVSYIFSFAENKFTHFQPYTTRTILTDQNAKGIFIIPVWCLFTGILLAPEETKPWSDHTTLHYTTRHNTTTTASLSQVLPW